MTMKCKICAHRKRLQIDREVVKGGNLTKIAKKFGIPYSSLYAHSQNHITRQLAQAMDKKLTIESFDLLSRIDLIIERAEKIFTRNYENNKDFLALQALNSQRSTLELLSKISYALHQAKMEEAELQRELNKEPEEEAEREYMERMKILTTPELEMLQKLSDKIEEQSDIIIIPEHEVFKYPSSENDYIPEPVVEDLLFDEPNMKRTKSKRMIVRPVEPEQIPSTKESRRF